MIGGNKNIVYDQWLAQILQRDVYKVIVDDGMMEKTRKQGSKEHKLLRELESKSVFLYSKVPAAFLPAVKFLREWNFNLIDTNVTFDKPIAPPRHLVGHCKVRCAASGDQGRVVDIAKRSFVYSRFHLDSAFPHKVANMIKAEWAKSYFTGNRGNAMVVASMDQSIVGFLLLLYREEAMIIDLIAVDENYRKRGVAKDMIIHAEAQCHGFSQILVGTQLANIPSIRLYEGMGFKVASAQYTFHYHNR
jgi:ribosomal protein S18 acetylase RimI-like enzyme